MKLFVSLLAVMAVASAAVAAPITTVTVDDFSGRLGSSWMPDNTLDGVGTTFWYSELSNDVNVAPFVIYAFDAVYEVGDVAITMSSGNYRKLDIAAMSVSTDGVTYTPAGTFTIDITDGAVTTFDLDADAKYVRLDGVGAHYNNWNGDPEDKATPGTAPDGKYGITFADISFNAVPEPGTISLLIAGGVALLRRKRA